MTTRFKDLVDRFTPSSSRKASPTRTSSGPLSFSKAPDSAHLFPVTNPLTDGEDCLHDCESCTIRLPSKFKIDEEDALYGHINAWHTHMIVATGKTDWVRDVADEKDSVMEAVGKHGQELQNGKLMLSASNIPVPDVPSTARDGDTQNGVIKQEQPTRVLLLPSFQFVENVTPSTTSALLEDYLAHLPSNTTSLTHAPRIPDIEPVPNETTDAVDPETLTTPPAPPPQSRLPPSLVSHPVPHNTLILVCSQKTRDARCGQSAPLLKRELERHLRPLGLYRDLNDERPGGVGIYFISHVGGHKYSANMMVYRRVGSLGAEVPKDPATNGHSEADGTTHAGEAAQCIWIARVRPEDCENIVRYTVLQGKVVKPERQLRGGFDRTRGLVSW